VSKTHPPFTTAATAADCFADCKLTTPSDRDAVMDPHWLTNVELTWILKLFAMITAVKICAARRR
jgi:hypothetical protein